MEVELKLDLDPADVAAAIASPLFDSGARATEHLDTVYFDTADHDLRAAGLSLRIRRIGERRILTVKAEGAAVAGLFARPEWERDVDDTPPTLGDLPEEFATLGLSGDLAPVFRAEVERTTIDASLAGTRIEVSIDRGELQHGAHALPLCELEMELREGGAAPLFGLARELDAQVPVRLGVMSKSERGYRLAERNHGAVKARAPVLAKAMTAGEAFARSVAACIRQYRLNEDLLRTGSRSAGALHQARIGLRRLRSALSLFRPVVADARVEALASELRWLAGRLGEARDIDVLIGRTEPSDLLDRLHEARDDAYAGIEATLASSRPRALLLDLAEWIECGVWRSCPETLAAREMPVLEFAAASLSHARKRLQRRGRRLAHLTDEHRHEARIAAKKLRYASEFFTSLYAPRRKAHDHKRFIDTLERLQKRLGELNDDASGVATLERLGLPLPDAVEPPAGREKRLAKAAAARHAVLEAPRFWR
ncbi:CHAD domain-containing protein [Sphingosinicellaceae bacterium]|nr:CHAD domain-containing protein [Sphingosinicellaceae bacterium]